MDHIRHGRVNGSSEEAEASYLGFRVIGSPDGRFGSQSMIGMVVCRPTGRRDAFAVVFDQKWPEYFGIFHRTFEGPDEATDVLRELESLERRSALRGEGLASEVVQLGWATLWERA